MYYYVDPQQGAQRCNVRDSSTADPATLDIFLRVNGSG